MPAAPQDFHYMTVLRELEKAVVELHPEKLKVANSQLADRVGELYDKVVNLKFQWASLDEKIDFRLGAEKNLQVKIEEDIVAHVAKLTGDRQHQPQHRRLTGQWPPMVPVARMIERFTALTIGLHSEDPAQPFSRHVSAAFREAVLPGLAWGVMVHLYARPKVTRLALQKAIGQHLRAGENVTELSLSADEKARVDYLLLVNGWFAALKVKSLGTLAESALSPLRTELADLIENDLGKLDTLLWDQLGDQYLSVIAGTERAMAVARAETHSAGSSAFLRERLALFEAAQEPDLQPFRNQVETDFAQALRWPFAALSAASGNIKAGKQACGGAFWLARATFGQHQPRDEEGLPIKESPHEEGSSHTVLLLLKAGLMFKHEAARSDQLLTCLRYAAGYATNPRYCRSLSVLRHQEKLVDLYEAHPMHRSSLVKMFRGRIAWQQSFAIRGERHRKEALKYYYTALKSHRDDRHGFDAEAPVHFFPELTHLLRPPTSKASKVAKTLDAVDFITQRNYGIYFDIEREAEKIDDGLAAYGRYYRMEIAAGLDSPLWESAKSKDPIAEFRRVIKSGEVQATLNAIEEISRALQFNR